MNKSNQYVIFRLDDRRYALYLSAVERIIRSVEITSLPKAPEIVLGIINLEGQVIPVVNTRKGFMMPERGIGLNDQFIIARTSNRTIVLTVDSVSGIIASEEHDMIPSKKIVAGMEYVDGVIKIKDDLILIYDLDRFISFDEDELLDGTIKQKLDVTAKKRKKKRIQKEAGK
ncbi:MAG: purine-binding chemotaxis protein CheW [Candidatus Latescibacteria bacterium]|jgi:purine-binding chemotaxis protein CheW|nr:purine-binding chemotaxis protein CheW [Bacteroidota bacterium]MBT4485488.1 purine-binding chemotaxis protein CheW [Candidatus Latescibacterota bacterium]